MYACVCVCVCASVWCVCVRIVRKGQILAKIKNVKNEVYRFWRVESGCDISSVVLRDLDLFQVQVFQMSIFRKRWELSKNAQVWSLYRLIFAIELDRFDCCTPWPFPKFSRSNFQLTFLTSIHTKNANILLPSDRKSSICNRTVLVPMLSIMTLTHIFKVTKFEKWISRKRSKLIKHAQVWLLYRLIFVIEWDHCECYTP